MKKKLDEYRKRLRQEQINERKESIRWTMVESIMREEKAEELDCSLRRCIEEGTARVFIEIYESADKDAIFSLPKPTIEEAYLCFCDDLMRDYHAAIVKSLLSNHAAIILLSPRLLQAHNNLITWSIKQISHIVQTTHEDTTSSVQNPLIILNIFLSRKNAKNLRIQDSKSFLLSILSWQEVLLNNMRYLQLFTSLLSHFLFTEQWNDLEFDCLLFALSRQTLTHNDSIAYLSLKVLNSLLSKLQNINEECMRELLPSYLGILERVFKRKNNEGSLMECLNQLEKMLKIVRQMNWRVGVGIAIQQNDTFQILSSINQIQHFPQRCLVYSIIEYATHIIAEQQDSQSLKKLRDELQCTLLLGLGNRFSNQITLNSIRAIQVLLRCQLIGYQCREAVLCFEKEGITSFLEYLQFNRNNQVAQIAASLFYQQYAEQYHQFAQ